jgi:hypothetical protein
MSTGVFVTFRYNRKYILTNEYRDSPTIGFIIGEAKINRQYS